MSGTFFGINVVQSGLAAQQKALNVLGYNIANANDPTYKRQRVVLTEGQPLAQSQDPNSVASTVIGSGVTSESVERVLDPLIDSRVRQTSTESAASDYRQTTMSQLEGIVGDQDSTGLQTILDNFWNSWQGLATTPDSVSLRGTLLDNADALCQSLHYVSGQMSNMVDDLNQAAVSEVDRINSLASEIGKLNSQIGASGSGGSIPSNDLLSRRDALVNDLAKEVNITQHDDGANGFIISVGGTVLVQGSTVNKITTTSDFSGNQQVVWEHDGALVKTNDGKLNAITDLRDQTIPSYMNQLDQVAQQLVTTVNEQHRKGVDYNGNPGGDFFQSSNLTAASICLHYDSNPPDPDNPALAGHPERIAASMPDNPLTLTNVEGGRGDGSNALAIAKLKEAATSTGSTINQMFRNLVTDVGTASSTAQTQAKVSQASLDQYTTQQQSISGVSMDEEMTNMIKFQQAYNAAAKVLGVMNDVLTTLVSTNM